MLTNVAIALLLYSLLHELLLENYQTFLFFRESFISLFYILEKWRDNYGTCSD